MKISKGSGNGIKEKKIVSVIVCFLIIITSINLMVLIDLPAIGVEASGSTTESRGSRAPNTDTDPTNDNINGADQITYGWPSRIIGATLNSGDPCDYWKIPIDYGTIKYNAQSKVIGTDNPVKLIILLDNQGIPGGVIMTIYDANKHELGTSSTADSFTQGNLTIIGQVNSLLYLKVFPAGGTGSYRLTIYNTTQPSNPAWDNRNWFETATKKNITRGFVSPNNVVEYLDYEFDNADFYKFDVIANQKIILDMTPTGGCDFDMYLFDSQDASAIIESSTVTGFGSSGKEKIVYISTTAQTLYLRVVVKIAGPIIGGRGNYTLSGYGNVPPFWNSSYPTKFVVDEDDPPFNIELEWAYYDINPSDQITYEIWNPTLGAGSWQEIPHTYTADNATIKLKVDIISSRTVLAVILGEDKFGTETISIRATDNSQEFYTEQNITIKINPKNDLPILNGTKQWKNGLKLTPSNDGTKLFGKEGELFETQVTAYDPVDPWDVITFLDNTELFDINPRTGLISFTPTYHITGSYPVEITARDNGTSPNETTSEFEFVFERGENFPVTNLLSPGANSVQYTLTPEFLWEQTNEAFFDEEINYELYLSTEKNQVKNRDKRALNASLNDTYFKLTNKLDDQTTYYWTVIPNDGLHLGECESGILSFSTDVHINIPSVNLQRPANNQMLDTKTVTLMWDLFYLGTENVKYDVFFEVSMEDITDRNRTPYKSGLTDTELEIRGLYTDKYYYWQVIPWTPKVRPRMDESEIRTFYVTTQIPRIKLLAPLNITRQYDNWVTLTWEVNYTNPDDVICELYYGTILPYSVTKINLTKTYSFPLTDLKDGNYFWKIIPYLGSNLRGKESEIRVFTIFHNPDLLRTKLIKPVNITLYSQFLTLEWEVILSNDVDISSVWYDIYLDNTTNDPSKMNRIVHDYRNYNYLLELPLEPKKTYYWYVVPHGYTIDAHIKGYCSSGVVYFDFDYAKADYNFNLILENSSLSIKPGNSLIFYFSLKNIGNRETSINVGISASNSQNNINFTLEKRKIKLELDGTERIKVTLLALPKAEPGNYTATIKGTSSEDSNTTKQDTIIINVKETKKEVETDGKDKDSGSDQTLLIGIIAVVVIIVIILIVLLVMRKRKPSTKTTDTAPVKSEEAQTGRTVAPVQPISPIQPVTPTTPTQLKPVQPIQPVKPVQPVQAIKPVQAVKPVQPVKPVQAVSPVSPVKPSPVTPVQPVQPVKPVAPAAVKPANPIQPKQ